MKHVCAWLLPVVCLHTCVRYSQQCRSRNTCTTEVGVEGSKETIHHGVGQQNVAHRNGPHRRKGSRARAEEIPPRIVHHPSDVVVKLGSPATLSCRADGSPKPTIEWLRNGQPLQTERGDGQLQPMVLSEGSLFFLNVGGDRRTPSHEGIYGCVARNAAGTAISRNASLYIAVLQDEFNVQPSDVEVADGEVAVLKCVPPVGHPEPNVIWKKDGLPINSTDRRYTKLSGKLIISPAEKSHSGSYICVARNTEGERESRAARVSVLAKPVLVLKPQNVSVKVGESAHFYCQAKGDPPPAVVWSREQGSLPNGRYLVNPDQTLQLHYVTVQDAGSYTCTAVNHVGVVTASAQLQVEEAGSSEQKDFHKELSALRVALDNVSIMATGSNLCLVQWKLQSFPSHPHYLDGFEVLYRSMLPLNSEWAAHKVTLPRFQAQVGPLKRGYKYEFKVRPYGSNLYGRESNTQHLRVPEEVPSAAPLAVSISVNHKQNDSIRLSWEPPPHESHNGVIQGYQVWCVESDEQQYQNWTVDSSQHKLDISTLKPGKQYWITMAAVNGAGVGVLSDPHGFVINPQLGSPPESEEHRQGLSHVLDLLQHPVLIGSIGALLWCILMVAAVYLFRRHSRMSPFLPKRGKAGGLCRLTSEDLIIKHRVAAPDSPWLSGSWRPPFNKKYQDLWAQGQKHPGIRSTSLPVSTQKDRSCLDLSVPVVTDSCGVYGTFYVDLMGKGMKTFNSPGRCPKRPHGLPHQREAETIQIFTQPSSKSSSCSSREALPWKQAIRPQPKMGVQRESWEKSHGKQELHAVNSVPVLSSRGQACPPSVYKQRLSHVPAGRRGGPLDCGAAACPNLLHYSASLHLVDTLPRPAVPTDDAADRNTLSSDEGSSRSTKLTEDTGSLQSVSPASGRRGQPGPNETCRPPYSHLSAALYSRSLDNEQDSSLTSQEATEYLELSPEPERSSSVLPEQSPHSAHHTAHHTAPTLSSLCGPVRSPQQDYDAAEPLTMGLRQSRPQSSPSSCYSDWDSSLWNTWSSVMDGNLDSARSSLISSVDSCYTNDSATLACLLATMSGASLTDLSPPASPLSALYPSLRPDGGAFGDLEPVPVWDWSLAWMEGVDFRAHYPGRKTT